MFIFNFIGYFTLVLCDFCPPQCYMTISSCFLCLQCHPYLPATLSELRLVCFLLILLPATIEVRDFCHSPFNFIAWALRAILGIG
jgi:hypothetical protein